MRASFRPKLLPLHSLSLLNDSPMTSASDPTGPAVTVMATIRLGPRDLEDMDEESILLT